MLEVLIERRGYERGERKKKVSEALPPPSGSLGQLMRCRCCAREKKHDAEILLIKERENEKTHHAVARRRAVA